MTAIKQPFSILLRRLTLWAALPLLLLALLLSAGPAQASGPDLPFQAISAGGFHTCGLRPDGSLICWGWNNLGQTAVPALPAGLSYTQVSAGGYHTCGLRSDGTLICWGSNAYGQTTVLALPAGVGYTQVSGGTGHTCGLRSDGSIACWGLSSDGRTKVPALFGRDTASPTVSGSARADANPTNAAAVDFTVTFSEFVTGVDATDFALTTSGLTGAAVSGVSGSGRVYTVTVSTGSGEGTLRLDVAANGSIRDAVNLPLIGTFTTGESYVVDTVAPTVVSSLRASASPTAATSVDFTVTFSEVVTGVDVGDFDLVTTGLSGASVSGVSGSGSVYTVTVDTGTGSGTLQLIVPASAAASDSLGNVLGSLPFTSGEAYDIDKTIPTVVSSLRADASPTTADNVDFTVTFSEDVTGVDVGDFDLVTSGVSGAAVTGVNGSGSVYTVSASTGSGIGDIQLTIPASATITDSVGNVLSSAFTSGESYEIGMSVYLPLVVNNFVSAPDLVVDNLSATGSQVTVTISNEGNAPVVDAFWVDVYLNPTTAPTAVNQPWPDLGRQGLVWGVEGAALPLDPGESLTLTIGDSYYWPDLSSFSIPLPAGASVYAQVDSANAQTSYGGVLESHEISGGTYNNISGPVLSLSGGVGFALPAGGLPVPVTGSSLPPRN